MSGILLPLVLPFLASSCNNTDQREDDSFIPVTPRPGWAGGGGAHPDFPERDFITATLSADGAFAPDRDAMRLPLARKLHEVAKQRLAPLFPDFLNAAAERGVWASAAHLPLHEIRYESWTDGFAAAAFVAVSRAALQRHNAARAVNDGAAPQRESREVDIPEESQALRELRSRVGRFAYATSRLITFALAADDGGTPLVEARETLIREATTTAEELLAFRDALLVSMTGGEQRARLGERIALPIELGLTYRGLPAAGLPVKAHLGGVSASASRGTDARGLAFIEFPEPAVYSGAAENLIGFALDPDALLPSTISGLVMPPWLTRLILPGAENTLIYLHLTEKISGKSIADGPIGRALREWLDEAGTPFVTKEPAANDPRFVLTIEGVVSCFLLAPSRATEAKQMRAEGMISLRSHRGAVLARSKIIGVATVVPGGEEAAARDALLDGWTVARRKLAEDFRAAFPPIFPDGGAR